MRKDQPRPMSAHFRQQMVDEEAVPGPISSLPAARAWFWDAITTFWAVGVNRLNLVLGLLAHPDGTAALAALRGA